MVGQRRLRQFGLANAHRARVAAAVPSNPIAGPSHWTDDAAPGGDVVLKRQVVDGNRPQVISISLPRPKHSTLTVTATPSPAGRRGRRGEGAGGGEARHQVADRRCASVSVEGAESSTETGCRRSIFPAGTGPPVANAWTIWKLLRLVAEATTVIRKVAGGASGMAIGQALIRQIPGQIKYHQAPETIPACTAVQEAASSASSASSQASSAAADSLAMAASRVFAAVTSAVRPGA
jgi:hypothetical protein